MLKYILFPIYGSILFEIYSKYGQDIHCENYEQFEKLFTSGKICSADIKPTISKLTNNFIKDIREEMIKYSFN